MDSDDDRDGRSLMAEFAFGGNPKVRDRERPALLRRTGDGRVELTWIRQPSAPEITYRIEASADFRT